MDIFETRIESSSTTIKHDETTAPPPARSLVGKNTGNGRVSLIKCAPRHAAVLFGVLERRGGEALQQRTMFFNAKKFMQKNNDHYVHIGRFRFIDAHANTCTYRRVDSNVYCGNRYGSQCVPFVSLSGTNPYPLCRPRSATLNDFPQST